MKDIVLSDNELHMLNAMANRANETALPVEDLIKSRQLTYSQGLSAIGYLCAKGLAESIEIGIEHKWILRKLGQEYEAIGLPEKRLWEHLVSTGSLTLLQVNEFLPPSEAKFTIGMYLGSAPARCDRDRQARVPSTPSAPRDGWYVHQHTCALLQPLPRQW